MTASKLLVVVVDRGRGEHIVSLARTAGAQGGTVVLGRGTASSTLLQILGLGGSERDIVLILVESDILSAIIHALSCDSVVQKKIHGLFFIIDVLAFLHHASNDKNLLPSDQNEENKMHTHVLISVVVNAGYAGDIMHMARKAGAKGGTLFDARGTAKEDDEKFFGFPIVPEKEFLMILAEQDSAPKIVEAIKSTQCLSQPGMGIVFCTPVEQVSWLGQN